MSTEQLQEISKPDLKSKIDSNFESLKSFIKQEFDSIEDIPQLKIAFLNYSMNVHESLFNSFIEEYKLEEFLDEEPENEDEEDDDDFMEEDFDDLIDQTSNIDLQAPPQIPAPEHNGAWPFAKDEDVPERESTRPKRQYRICDFCDTSIDDRPITHRSCYRCFKLGY